MKVEFDDFNSFLKFGSLASMSVVSMQSALNSAKIAFDDNKSFHGALQDAFDSYAQIVVSCENLGIGVEYYKPFDWWCSQSVCDDVFIGVIRAYMPKLDNKLKAVQDVLKCQK